VRAQRIDLNSVVSDAQRMLKRLVGEDIALHIKLEPSATTVAADTGQIHQVIMNLVVNARDAMPRGGSILIETAVVELGEYYAERHPDVPNGTYVLLAVSDTGSGMDESVKSRVFEPFFTTKPRGMGTGLGLATVYGIVKQSGGWIWVYSEPGKGSTFKIYLPRLDPAHVLEGEKEADPPLGGTETVLLVEDQPDVRKLAATVLRKRNYVVLEASGGEEALALCERIAEPIHLVLTDVVMPGLSGPELVEKLKASRPELKVLFMSGYTENATLHSGVLYSDVAYIPKPFTAEGLARKVREVLGRPTSD
jgi:CheY-like chemotaxis protein